MAGTENKHVHRLHILAFVLGEKIPPASASNQANPSVSFLPSSSAEKPAAVQEKALKKGTVVISDIMACRIMLPKTRK